MEQFAKIGLLETKRGFAPMNLTLGLRPSACVCVGLLAFGGLASAQGETKSRTESVREKFSKQEVRIPMRDGVKLFTVIYSPRDTSQRYPILMVRTPYSVGPYGEEQYKGSLGLNHLLEQEGYMLVYQDVRGRLMSEGEFDNMRPH